MKRCNACKGMRTIETGERVRLTPFSNRSVRVTCPACDGSGKANEKSKPKVVNGR